MCLSVAMRAHHGLSFKAGTSKLCMQPLLTRALVLGRSRPASAASEAVSWFALFPVSKNHRRRHFSRLCRESKVAQRPRFRGTGWPQIQPPRSLEDDSKKIAILHSRKFQLSELQKKFLILWAESHHLVTYAKRSAKLSSFQRCMTHGYTFQFYIIKISNNRAKSAFLVLKKGKMGDFVASADFAKIAIFSRFLRKSKNRFGGFLPTY